MINKFNGIYKTKYPIPIAPQEPDVKYILNACPKWTYDENTHEFTLMKESPTGRKLVENIKICLDDYDFETDTFEIALHERVLSASTPGITFDLAIKPIHPYAAVKTTYRVFTITYEEAEKLSHNPASIPCKIIEEFSSTEPFDLSIIEILHNIEARNSLQGWTQPQVVPFSAPLDSGF